ncbi:MAG TPA: hypothetical protein VM938_04690 [Acidimicrobiales bacterium]|nr:hypothetical protein [Acidimicrobiales bacterium]
MKRRLALLLAAASIATVGMLAPTSPASADTDVCAGTGTATLGAPGLGYPVVTPSRTVPFSFGFTAGTCTPVKTSLSASGTVTGNCGLSTGSGSTTNGHSFSFTSTGTVLVLTGDLSGTVSAVPDATHSGSCTNGTATRFLITGEVVKTHGTVPSLCPSTNTTC